MFSQWLGIRGLDAAIPLALISGIIGLCWTLPAALLPIAVLSHLGDAQKASILFFGVSVFGVAGSIAVPLLVHHLGRRFIIVLGITLTIFSGVCLSIPTVWALIGGATLRVFGFVCIDVIIEMIIMERIPKKNLARFESVRMFSMGVGLITGPLLGTIMASRLSISAPFFLMIGALLFLHLYLFRSSLANNLTNIDQPNKPPNPLRFIHRFIQQPRLRLSWLLAFMRSSWWTMFFIYGPIYCVQSGLGQESAGALLSIGSTAILFAPVFGKIGSKIGVRYLLAIGYISTGISTMLVAVFASSVWFGIVFLLAAATCAAIIDAVGNALFLRAAHAHERGEMTAVFLTYREVAQLAPPGLFSIVLTSFALPAVFVLSGASMMTMVIFTRFIPKSFR